MPPFKIVDRFSSSPSIKCISILGLISIFLSASIYPFSTIKSYLHSTQSSSCINVLNISYHSEPSLIFKNPITYLGKNRLRPFQPKYQLLIFNTYRTDKNSFSCVGFRRRKMASTLAFILSDLGNCSWIPNAQKKKNHAIDGNMTVIFPGDHHHNHYAIIIINCTFMSNQTLTYPGKLAILMDGQYFEAYEDHMTVSDKVNDQVNNPVNDPFKIDSIGENVEKEVNGFESTHVISNPDGPSSENSDANGVLLEGDNYKNGQDSDRNFQNDPTIVSNYKYNIAYCSPPTFGHLNQKYFLEWLEYHKIIGVQYFIYFDAGIQNMDFADFLSHHMQKDAYEYIDIKETKHYELWNYGQVMTNNDCNLKMRHVAKWVLFIDYDEYIMLPPEFRDLHSFLKMFDGKSFLTFGSLFWDIKTCLKDEKEDEKENGLYGKEEKQLWAIEKLIFHEKEFQCRYEKMTPDLCTMHFGHRKFITAPLLTTAVVIHDCVIPKDTGVHLNATYSRLNHYRGLASVRTKNANETNCKIWYENGQAAPQNLVQDMSTVEFVKSIKSK